MDRYILHLLEDQPQTGVISAAALAAEHRVIYVVEGEAAIAAAGEATTVTAHAAWYGSGAWTITCGTPEVRLLR